MKTQTIQNSHNNLHNNPDVPAVPTELNLPETHLPIGTAADNMPAHLRDVMKHLPRAIIDRKFRLRSFGSQLNAVQRSMLTAWLCSDDSIDQICAKVAAPPPNGFGMKVCPTTICRMRDLVENTHVVVRVAHAMDCASDLLESGEAGDVAPLREALSLILYSRAINAAKNQAAPEVLDKLLSSISKVEKLKPAVPLRSSGELRPATIHKVELSITSAPPKSAEITVTPVTLTNGAS